MTSAIELKREKKIIGSSLEAEIELLVPVKIKNYLKNENLNDIFIVSSTNLVNKLSKDYFSLDDVKNVKVSVNKAKGAKCERCWAIAKAVETNKENLCNRCLKVINEIEKK